MFTNYFASLVYALLGNAEMAEKYDLAAKLIWFFDKEQAITDLAVGGLSCGLAAAIVAMIATKINSKLQVA